MPKPLDFRRFSPLDALTIDLDAAVRTIFLPKQRAAKRQNPACNIEESPLLPAERNAIAGYMRVNHSGEVCAQALYQGQALTAKLDQVREQMTEAAWEEVDHLAWCEQRLQELNSQASLLNPLWYFSSFLIGAFAGLVGDAWSLGFVAETERQVAEHLRKHQSLVPAEDKKTQAILGQMLSDEIGHAELAENAGGRALPYPIQMLMRLSSKLMTKTSYHL